MPAGKDGPDETPVCAGGGGAGLSTNWLKDNLVSIFFPQMRLNLFS